ncbi:MAG: class I SAM-dependent methyltransferase [Sulfurimonas sp.]
MPRINNKQFYLSAIKQHGHSAKGLNWSSQTKQIVRFEQLLELLPDDLSKITVADAGCGFGDLYTYMLKQFKMPKEYLGIDSIQEMCSLTKGHTACSTLLADICKDTLPTKDFYVCSGALNILTPFETHQFISNCFKASKYGFIFNALHGDKQSDTFNYISTQTIQNIAKELGVKEIVFKDNYIENDITVGFFK